MVEVGRRGDRQTFDALSNEPKISYLAPTCAKRRKKNQGAPRRRLHHRQFINEDTLNSEAHMKNSQHSQCGIMVVRKWVSEKELFQLHRVILGGWERSDNSWRGKPPKQAVLAHRWGLGVQLWVFAIFSVGCQRCQGVFIRLFRSWLSGCFLGGLRHL